MGFPHQINRFVQSISPSTTSNVGNFPSVFSCNFPIGMDHNHHNPMVFPAIFPHFPLKPIITNPYLSCHFHWNHQHKLAFFPFTINPINGSEWHLVEALLHFLHPWLLAQLLQLDLTKLTVHRFKRPKCVHGGNATRWRLTKKKFMIWDYNYYMRYLISNNIPNNIRLF